METAPTAAPSPPAQEPRERAKSRDIPSLDGFRAVAVSLVFVAHGGLEHRVPGGFGVTLFFFLSGFLITTLMRAEFEKTGSVSIKNFYIRRFLRIFPPLYITVTAALALAVAGIIASNHNGLAVASHYLFFTNYFALTSPVHDSVNGMGPLWSLAVEEHFYLMFPLIFAFVLARYPALRQAKVILAFCALVLIHRTIVAFYLGSTGAPGWDKGWTYLATDCRLDSIAFGCILALYRNPVLDPEVREKPPSIAWFWVGIAALIGCLLFRNPYFRESLRYSIQGLALMPVFTAAILWWDKPLFAWLNTPITKWLAAFSYTIYLFHYLSFLLVDRFVNLTWVERAFAGGPLAKLHPELMVRGFIAAVVVVAYAFLLYVLVEKPIARWRKRFS